MSVAEAQPAERARGRARRPPAWPFGLAALFAGALALWVGVPVLWLFVGSLVQGATQSVGVAILLMFVGSVTTIALCVPLLGRLNEAYEHLREARGLESSGQLPLEMALVFSAAVAVVLFCVWFFFLAGTSPLPATGGRT
jgi:hypothetical protein